MKKTTVLIGMMFLFPAVNFAGDEPAPTVAVGVKVKNELTATGGNANAQQKQESTNINELRQDQTQIMGDSTSSSNANNKFEASNFGNVKITSPGNLPVATANGVGMSTNQTGEYGHTITQSSLDGSAMLFCGMTGSELGTMIQVINEEGTDSWESVHGKIKSHPFIRHRFTALGNSDKVFLPSGENSLRILQKVNNSQLVGGWFYDTKFNKNNAVLVQHLQMQVQVHAAKMGANVVIAIDQFDQRYFVPENFEVSVGGVLSWISKVFTNGSSIAGSAGAGAGKNTMYVRPGAAFVFLRVEGLTDEICYEQRQAVTTTASSFQETTVVATQPITCNPSEVLAQIEELKRKIALCNYFCFNNLQLRAALGEKYIELAVCTSDKKYFSLAITEGFEVAERNFRNGKDISKNRSEATAIMQRVHYLQAGSINQVYGIQSATEFANRNNLEKFPRSFQQ